MFRTLLLLGAVAGSLILAQDDTAEDEAEKMMINVAVGKPTVQSSTGHQGTSDKAVDGKTSGRYWDLTCTHGNNEGVQWWQVDLEAVYDIAYIEIFGRTDCCGDRIDNNEVWIGNNLCTKVKYVNGQQVNTIKCDNPANQKGRIIKIKTLGTLTLCEVKVFVETKVSYSVAATDTPAEHKGQAMRSAEGVNYTNVAVDKHASQSSTGHNGWAARGVDGYTNGHWNHRSCAYTRNSGMNYWEVDLGRVYKIDHMVLYGRTDREPTWLNGATVKVGAVACQTVAGIEKEGKVRIDCGGDPDKLIGQVIRVEEWNQYVVVCELQVLVKTEELPKEDEVFPTINYAAIGEVIDDYYNVAKGKNTTTSSQISFGKPELAVDGVTSQHWNQQSCTHTNRGGTQWWQVDLGRVYQIDHIRIWGRTDAHENRLHNARLWIGDHRCGKLKSMGKAAEADVIKCSPEESAGRYVKIEQFNEYLTLCEVQVMVNQGQVDLEPKVTASRGERVGNFTNVALRRDAWQSSEGWSGVAARAVDGWSNGHWSAGTCTHTNQQGVHTWHVDLGRPYKIDHVTFYGRTDCCTDRMKWVNVFAGRTKCGYLSEEGYETGMPWTIQCSNNEERGLGDIYAQVIQFERLSNYLTLCEVQVMVKNEDLDLDAETPTSVQTVENVARHKPVQQSSIGWHGEANRAVDGYHHDHSALWNTQSCTHTLKEPLNTWEVDLGREYYIDRIEVLGRGDCCRERLEGATVEMDNKTVASLSYTHNQLRWNIPLYSAKGRHFRVSLLNEYLTICEFQVIVDHEYDASADPENQLDLTEENLALNKAASSSSVGVGGEPGKAVDGNSEGNFYRGSCMSTAVQQGVHWWSVDLGGTHSVGHVIIYPRLDYTDSKALIHEAEVFVGEHSCGKVEYVENRPWYRVACKGVSGSSVTVKKEAGYLQFCEVIVQKADD